MKKTMLIMLVAALAVSALCTTAFARTYDDSVQGLYSLYVTMPADHDHVYLYDQPSSTKGRNLGRIDNGDLVYVYYITEGLNSSSWMWAYCDFMGTEGYIRFCNLQPEDCVGWYDDYDGDYCF